MELFKWKWEHTNPSTVSNFAKLQNFIVKILIFHCRIPSNNLPKRDIHSKIRRLHLKAMCHLSNQELLFRNDFFYVWAILNSSMWSIPQALLLIKKYGHHKPSNKKICIKICRLVLQKVNLIHMCNTTSKYVNSSKNTSQEENILNPCER